MCRRARDAMELPDATDALCLAASACCGAAVMTLACQHCLPAAMRAHTKSLQAAGAMAGAVAVLVSREPARVNPWALSLRMWLMLYVVK